jgi:(p)ppGpp synthase/HD superfamily hydrolase
MVKLQEAIKLAVSAHDGQVDKAGMPYILHPMRVMLAVAKEAKTHPLAGYTLGELMIAAMLHDVVEDTQVTLKQIENTFGGVVALIVDALSHRSGEVYRAFILRAKENPAARLIKVADVLDNLSRIDSLPPEQQGIESRYRTALTVLNGTRELSLEIANEYKMKQQPEVGA